MRPRRRRIVAAVGITSVLMSSAAWADCTEDAMIVFDGSGSMAEMGFNQIDEPRIFEARRAMRRAMPQVAPFRRIGLIIYGPGGAGGAGECSGVDLRFGPRNDAAEAVIDAVDNLEPEGRTALTEAVTLAADTLGVSRQAGDSGVSHRWPGNMWRTDLCFGQSVDGHTSDGARHWIQSARRAFWLGKPGPNRLPNLGQCRQVSRHANRRGICEH